MNKRQSLTASAAGMILVIGAQSAHARPSSPSAGELMSEAGHMGLSVQAWQEYRAGERSSASNTGAQRSTSGAMGGRQAEQSRRDTDMNSTRTLARSSIAAALSAAAIPTATTGVATGTPHSVQVRRPSTLGAAGSARDLAKEEYDDFLAWVQAKHPALNMGEARARARQFLRENPQNAPWNQ